MRSEKMRNAPNSPGRVFLLRRGGTLLIGRGMRVPSEKGGTLRVGPGERVPSEEAQRSALAREAACCALARGKRISSEKTRRNAPHWPGGRKPFFREGGGMRGGAYAS